MHLTAPAFRSLSSGDLAGANAVSPVPLPAYFAGPEWRAVWHRRSRQVEENPASAAWVTGVIWDERRQVAVGRAGYHGPPDRSGMVEIGYAVDPAYRRRGYARAALEAHCRARPGRPHRVRALPTGAVGEILTRGYHVMKGCLGNPSATAEAVDTAGWPHAGDLDSMDERGYCRIEGRLKEMIIRGGDSIYPREVEQLLHAHPAVADVAVVGVPVRRLLGRAGGSVCQACPAVHA